MGESTFVKTSPGYKSASSLLKRVRIHVDWPLAIAVGILLLISIVFVFSSSVQVSLNDKQPFTYYGARNLTWIILGCIICLVASSFNYRRINKYLALVIMAGVILLLVYTVIKGDDDGAGRGVFGASFQPSEFVKLGLIIYLSIWLKSKQEVLSSFSLGIVPFGAIVGLVSGLIVLQGDFSAAVTVFMLGLIMFLAAGGKWRQFLLFGVALIIAGGLVLVLAGGNRMERITDFFGGLKDPGLASDHVQRAADAITSGGLFGIGLGESISKYIGLPVPWTDSIFAVIVEEAGSIFGFFVIVVYLFILWRGLTIANRTNDLTGKLIASGISIWITLEAAMNIGALINLAPFGGNVLPLVSYGGSAMWAMLAGIGILMNISGSGSSTNAEEGRSYGAVVDLRRRNGRRSVSRPRSS